MNKRTWSVKAGCLTLETPGCKCGCEVHFARTPLYFLEDSTLKELVREMSRAMDKYEGLCPFEDSHG